MSKFMVSQTHPLIPRDQTYVLERKIVSIHSYDRDIKKWPNSNHFEIELPQALTNIQSMRLLQISLPNNQYVFSDCYQNTKLQFTVGASSYIIQIEEGSYTPDQLAIEITNKMNAATGTTEFICKYNSVTNTFWFGNTTQSFTLNFSVNIYANEKLPCNCTRVWNHYTKWGLPSYLGYEKQDYTAMATTDGSGFSFSFETSPWLEASGGAVSPFTIKDPSCNLDIFGEDVIYMEVEKYNSIDELEPYSVLTSSLYNNDYAGKVNSAFAKIPIVNAKSFATYTDSTNFFLMNVKQFSPPIDRLTRLRFTFRYHDGRLVDFKCLPINFSLEFNMLRDEQRRNMNVRIPHFFNMMN